MYIYIYVCMYVHLYIYIYIGVNKRLCGSPRHESCNTYKKVTSHIWMSHVTHITTSIQMAHIWKSHVTHIYQSCHTYERVMSHMQIQMATSAAAQDRWRLRLRARNYAGHHSSVCVTWFIESFMRVQWFVDMRAMIFSKTDGDYASVHEIIQVVTHLYVHYSVNCGSYVHVSFHMCDTIIGYRRLCLCAWKNAGRDSFICVTWLDCMCGMTLSYVLHDAFICRHS